ncbi:copper resistance protein B [Aphanothece sacrum]|uniref:Copper resistance protein CopB n=1 Tax=Aphanothece sacrum FPU1 TaxID=1920663 RepID=A0A401ILT3_APHSA|nr:copper resistance protein B [Aphanothece sacrum]GBF82209.1 copper resistance protein CopB [Aphanothece sacrum FPU1]GBF87253.1 copper resistance protein B [Aphanothece sacrum FPU3]
MSLKTIIYSSFLTGLLSCINFLTDVSTVKSEIIQNLEKFKLNETIINSNQDIFTQDFGENIVTNESLNQEFAQQDDETPNKDEENWPSPIEDDEIFWFLLVDQLEYRGSDSKDFFRWDIEGWVGGDYERIWLKTEGEVAFAKDDGGEAEIQLLYGYLIAPFWDLQVGLRYDRIYGSEDDRGRAFAVIGLEGLAPDLYEVDTALFISENGDLSARFQVEQELLITQKLILQPRFEINVAAQKVENFGIGSGVNDIELGLRLRYEINRNYAPYLGINWIRLVGETENLARKDGESVDNFSVVGGIRMLF